MKWEKLGRILEPVGQRPWLKSHAADPVPRHLGGDIYRIYCTGRDESGRGQIGWFEIDLRSPHHQLAFADESLLSPGPLGGYDDNGVVNACIVDVGDREYHYFSGMTLGVTVPFYFFVGLAISEDKGATLRKLHSAPILERNAVDPYLTGSPWVMFDRGMFRMWYTSGVRWVEEDGEPKHYYHIKYAESADGITWNRAGIVAIDFVGSEYVAARPCVVHDGDLYRMWYSYRGESYRLGYAESADGISWERRDDLVGIDVSARGWDADMIEYATVFDHGGERYMLYNGNGYGRSGIGLARLMR